MYILWGLADQYPLRRPLLHITGSDALIINRGFQFGREAAIDVFRSLRGGKR